MYACMYVWLYVCVWGCMYVYMHTHTHTHAHTNTLHTWGVCCTRGACVAVVCMCGGLHVYLYAHAHAHTRTQTHCTRHTPGGCVSQCQCKKKNQYKDIAHVTPLGCVLRTVSDARHLYMYMCIYMYVYTRTHTHTHKHTHTHTHTNMHTCMRSLSDARHLLRGQEPARAQERVDGARRHG